MLRIGHGYDVHRFGGDGPIVLGGVPIAYEQGFVAHSDGDVLIHALCDAILGALALGDIGKFYPDNDPQYAGIDSRKLLRDVMQKAKERGYSIANADLTIIAQAPKMAPHISAMRECLSSDLNCDISSLNVKATTTEKLGFTGEKLGIACHAVILLLETNQ
ncbi:2-C-methyl-D-erythritol 2,4-cyclodiphosphate synthase [Alginatibacterium sediminis]|uniref:2-C-methyl-D-erythritol 2,4-cyclodiphosphate synthase n=1 Tax=Alginatibacterium sediminis TaxID=2164068 RepID=A0A420ED11_9ALTE|nr:2-C-methyl-D-erythritol 2,4-cyclodiphosphate synthase [Alginatibacterium sediminis]RKF18619.1 2-C-methyl-D-erythritol 2,4-cyclodiphosphate synthase [Alginatibacterium sediminis]